MKPYLCTSCSGMNKWDVVNSDTMPEDDAHHHGWREATGEEAAKSTVQTMDEHEQVHADMGKM